jgi:hypothetical protein
MEFVLDEPDAVARIRQAAQRRAELQFSLGKMIAAHRDLYHQLAPKEQAG